MNVRMAQVMAVVTVARMAMVEDVARVATQEVIDHRRANSLYVYHTVVIMIVGGCVAGLGGGGFLKPCEGWPGGLAPGGAFFDSDGKTDDLHGFSGGGRLPGGGYVLSMLRLLPWPKMLTASGPRSC